jgi:hypothetical protein
MPEDPLQIVEAYSAAVFLNRSVEGDNCVPAAILPPREADISHNNYKPPARHEDPVAVLPYLIQLR